MAAQTVLVVEDDPSFALLLCTQIGLLGVPCIAASTAGEAIRLSQRTTLVAAVIDMFLPGQDGIAVFVELRQIHPSLIGFMVTGHGDSQVAFACGQAGFAGYFQKGDDTVDVLMALTAALDGRLRGSTGAINGVDPIRPALERVFCLVDCVDAHRADVPTLAEWARVGRASVGTVRSWCRTAGLRAGDVLHFARAQRAWRLWREDGIHPEHVLDFSDFRSRRRFLESAGLDGASPGSATEFVARQRFLPPASPMIEAALQRLGHRRRVS